MKRGEVYWANVPAPFGRRPVVVLTRDAAIPVLRSVVVAPVSRTVRGIASEVPLGSEEGLAHRSAATCDSLVTLPRSSFDPEPVGRLARRKIAALDSALRYALGVRF